MTGSENCPTENEPFRRARKFTIIIAMERNEHLIKEARSRTPDTWYFNQYVDGRLVMSHGFPNEDLAQSFARSVDQEIESAVRSGAKLRENVMNKVELAIAWRVGDHEFHTFADALFHKWTENPNAYVEGVFRT